VRIDRRGRSRRESRIAGAGAESVQPQFDARSALRNGCRSPPRRFSSRQDRRRPRRGFHRIDVPADFVLDACRDGGGPGRVSDS
jgi:hypothetical protein